MSQSSSLRHLPAGPAHALDDLPAGVLLVDAGGAIEFANATAAAFFAPLHPAGLSVRALVRLAGASNGSELAAALEAGQDRDPVRIGLADGRVLDARWRRRGEGGEALTLLDVTNYVLGATAGRLDPLTELCDRAGLQDSLASLLAARRATSAPFALLRISLNRFKDANMLGRTTGDDLLKKVAERLRSACGEVDVIARPGGAEFAIIQTTGAQPDAAESLAARLVDLLGRTYVVQGYGINISASIGIAVYPGDGEDADILKRHAGLAVAHVSTGSAGGFCFFENGMDAEMQTRRLLETDMRRALALKEFELAYQPQVNLVTGRITGFEALLRWKNAGRGSVSPAEFIPLAEEIGLIVPLGEWALRTACAAAVSWPREITIAVNISAVQFQDGKIVQTVMSALAVSGLDPKQLVLEITEGALLDDTDAVVDALRKLKSLGICIAMDDFGTGYSALGYLRKFPFDKIKIDQSFVRGSDGGAESAAIVKAIAGLGASLGMTSIAEGVETQDQMERVRAAGCTDVQGYLTGRPMCEADAAELIRKQGETG